jgi:hypothetical protein
MERKALAYLRGGILRCRHMLFGRSCAIGAPAARHLDNAANGVVRRLLFRHELLQHSNKLSEHDQPHGHLRLQ